MRHSKRNNKVIITIITCVLLILVGVAVWFALNTLMHPKKPTENKQSSSSQNSSQTSSQSLAKNDLTGLEVDAAAVNSRPIGVMINNIDLAQPLLGISRADVMYECPVEGGITRILAIFKNPAGVAKIGSVRSARPYFINIAQGLDAIYTHIGGSTQATEMLQSNDIDSFDLGVYSDMMWRDQTRLNTLGYEHSALTSGDKLIKGVDTSGIRTKMKSSYTFKQKFSDTDSQVNSGTDATKIKAIFSSYKSTLFEYDKEKKVYLVSQFNEPQMDDDVKIQNSRENVILLKANVTQINPQNDLKAVAIVGSGKAQYINRGKCIDINWSKASPADPIKYTTTDGKELIMAPGRIYICVLPLDADILMA